MTHARTLALSIAIAFAPACGGTRADEPPAPIAPSEPVPPSTPTAPEDVTAPTASLSAASAAAIARSFVREHGYTDAEATISEDQLRREMTDRGSFEEVLTARRNGLEPEPVGAIPEGDGFLVGFRYRDPSDPEAGRAVRVRPGTDPEFVHQDIRLSVFADIEVIARLVEHPNDNLPHCGDMHFAVAMKYQVQRVIGGQLAPTTIVVIHGCPEMPRNMYGGADAGDLERFAVGDTHRLTLTRVVPGGTGGPSVWDEIADASLERFWAVRADGV